MIEPAASRHGGTAAGETDAAGDGDGDAAGERAAADTAITTTADGPGLSIGQKAIGIWEQLDPLLGQPTIEAGYLDQSVSTAFALDLIARNIMEAGAMAYRI